MAISGEGLIQVTRANGSLAYTRAGNLNADANGRLALPSGELLQPRVTIPANANGVTIGPDGTVSATINGNIQKLGQITLATFTNPAGLEAVGDNLYVATANSGAAQAGVPGSGNRGTLAQGALEGSNVDVAV